MLSMVSMTHAEEENRDVAKDVTRLAHLGVKLIDSTKRRVVVMSKTKTQFCLN